MTARPPLDPRELQVRVAALAIGLLVVYLCSMPDSIREVMFG